PRNWPSAVITATAPASMMRSCTLFAEKPPNTTEWVGDARAGLHCDHRLDRHRHVDEDTIALLDAARLERVREPANLVIEALVGDLRHLAVVGLEDDRGLVGLRLEMPVEAVVGS